MKIGGDLNANKEHTHNIGNNNRRDPSRRKGYLNASGAIAVKRKIHKDDADATEDEHEARRKSLDNILAVDAAGEEDDGANSTRVAILCRADTRGLNDDVVDDAGYDHKVSEEDEGVDSHW